MKLFSSTLDSSSHSVGSSSLLPPGPFPLVTPNVNISPTKCGVHATVYRAHTSSLSQCTSIKSDVAGSPSAFLLGWSKVIRKIIAWKKGEPGNEAKTNHPTHFSEIMFSELFCSLQCAEH